LTFSSLVAKGVVVTVPPHTPLAGAAPGPVAASKKLPAAAIELVVVSMPQSSPEEPTLPKILFFVMEKSALLIRMPTSRLPTKELPVRVPLVASMLDLAGRVSRFCP
jgi:hypothetical protein